MDSADPAHAACVALLEGHPGRLVVPVLTIAEAAHLIEGRAGPAAEAHFLGDLVGGELSIEPVHAADWERILELVVRHADMRLGKTDASVVAAAERLGITRVATLDRRHFTAVRPRHAEAFELPLLG